MPTYFHHKQWRPEYSGKSSFKLWKKITISPEFYNLWTCPSGMKAKMTFSVEWKLSIWKQEIFSKRNAEVCSLGWREMVPKENLEL